MIVGYIFLLSNMRHIWPKNGSYRLSNNTLYSLVRLTLDTSGTNALAGVSFTLNI